MMGYYYYYYYKRTDKYVPLSRERCADTLRSRKTGRRKNFDEMFSRSDIIPEYRRRTELLYTVITLYRAAHADAR